MIVSLRYDGLLWFTMTFYHNMVLLLIVGDFHYHLYYISVFVFFTSTRLASREVLRILTPLLWEISSHKLLSIDRGSNPGRLRHRQVCKPPDQRTSQELEVLSFWVILEGN